MFPVPLFLFEFYYISLSLVFHLSFYFFLYFFFFSLCVFIPGQALRVAGCIGSQISRQSEHEGGKVVSPTHRSPLPTSKYSWYSFLLEAECGWKDYVNEKYQ